jgi:hypothetical protein
MTRKPFNFISALGGVGVALLLSAAVPAAAQDSMSRQPGLPGMKRCTAYWHSHKAKLRAAGKTRKEFMGACLGGTWVFD